MMSRNHLVRAFLERRGYTDDVLYELNNDSHDALLDVDVLASRLKEYHDNKEQIVVLPDFDMDGICSGVVAFAGLCELGFNAALFRPDPSDGYGFTADTINKLIFEFPNTKSIITCDVGITCYEGVEEAKRLGVDVFVTDHHMPGNGTLKSDILVDPSRVDDTYKNKGICGAHVIWQVLQGYADTYCSYYERSQIRRLCVFAGIGTISDSMPLLYENRQLVRDALSICRLAFDPFFLEYLSGHDVYRRAFRGLSAVLSMFEQKGVLSDVFDIDETFLGYYLAPMFNSVKRMNGDMDVAFGVFFGNDPQKDAETLYELNQERKEVVRAYYEDMLGTDQPFAPYVYLSNAPSGLLGLLAMKVHTSSGEPVFVLRQDGNVYHGSGRTPSWFPGLSILRDEGFYVSGHESAFGIGFTDKTELKGFVTFLNHDIPLRRPVEIERYVPDIYLSTYDVTADSMIDIPLFLEFTKDIKSYGPFGAGFEAPVVSFTFRPSDGEWFTMGASKQHFKVILSQGFEVIVWNASHRIDEFKKASVLSVIGELKRSEFNGASKVAFYGDMEVLA